MSFANLVVSSRQDEYLFALVYGSELKRLRKMGVCLSFSDMIFMDMMGLVSCAPMVVSPRKQYNVFVEG